MRNKRIWWVLGILLLVAGVYYWRMTYAYEVRVFETAKGWGYQIEQGGKPFIHQPMIPGIVGEKGFANAEQARKAGDLVVEKIRNRQLPPSLTVEELKGIGVEVP